MSGRQLRQQAMQGVPDLMPSLRGRGTRVASIGGGTRLLLLPIEGPLIDNNAVRAQD